MKKRIITLLLIIVFSAWLMISASADFGPKPSVVVTVEGLEGESYYVTLLSEKKSTGPYSKHDGPSDWMDAPEIWYKLDAYIDSDGFYFLGHYEDCSDSHRYEWGYYPPYTFKILIYFPGSDSFLVSGIYERYAFDSYFTVDASALTEGGGITARKSYEYGWELLSLVCRIVGTIAVELGIAWLFRYRTRRHLKVICAANAVTQTLLNVTLNIIDYSSGYLAFVFFFVLLEIAVFIIEGLIYRKPLSGADAANSYKQRRPWAYAFAANLVSAVVGMLLARVIPGIF